MKSFFEFLIVGFFVVLALAIVVYIAQSIFLNKFNKLVNGKGTPMAWIPIANLYLLGKLTVNKLVGWLLVIGSFAGGTVTTTVNGVERTRTILPEFISAIFEPLYFIVVFGLFIYAIVKYNRLKKYKKSAIQSAPQQEVNQANQMGTRSMNQTSNINNQVTEAKTYAEQPQQQVSNQTTQVSSEPVQSQVNNESVSSNSTQNQSDDPFDNWM